METDTMNRGWLRRIVAGLGAMAIVASVVPSANAGVHGDAAEFFISDLAANGINMLADSNFNDDEREVRFREIVRDGFALESIGKFVVGRYWRKMTIAQKREYIELFSEWLLKSYANRLGGFRGQTLEVVKSVETDSRYKDVIVTTRVLREDGSPPIKADWRVRKFGDNFKIIDVAVEGASMVGTQRKEFESVIQKQGVDGFIDTLRKRLAGLIGDTG